MKTRYSSLILIGLLLNAPFANGASAESLCETLLQHPFATNQSGRDSTHLLEYLSFLHKNGVITTQDLSEVLSEAKEGRWLNPVSERDAATSSEKMVAHDTVESYLGRTRNVEPDFIQNLEDLINNSNQARQTVEQTESEVIMPYIPLRFAEIEIDGRTIELAQNKLTQFQFAAIAGYNPTKAEHMKYLSDSKQTEEIYPFHHNQAVTVAPNHPIAGMKHSEIVGYFKSPNSNQFSQGEDLSVTEVRRGARTMGHIYEKGFLDILNSPQSDAQIARIKKVIPDYSRDYQYRLLYNSEYRSLYEMILASFGLDRSSLPTLSNHSNESQVNDLLRDYAYMRIDGNYNGSMLPEVGSVRRPIEIQGKKFWDLLGPLQETPQDTEEIDVAGQRKHSLVAFGANVTSHLIDLKHQLFGFGQGYSHISGNTGLYWAGVRLARVKKHY